MSCCFPCKAVAHDLLSAGYRHRRSKGYLKYLPSLGLAARSLVWATNSLELASHRHEPGWPFRLNCAEVRTVCRRYAGNLGDEEAAVFCHQEQPSTHLISMDGTDLGKLIH